MIEEYGPTPVDALREIMRRLRDPETGCPWDIEQTFETIAPYTVEEAYEVADAIRAGDREALRGELGDLLLQAVYHAQMAEEEGAFDFDDVARGIAEKMIRRHPHVFGDTAIASAEEQTAHWETVKQAERDAAGTAGPDDGALAGVALALPALMRAQKLQRRAARVGFDWPDHGGVLAKIAEEAGEVAEAREGGDREAVAEEYGDLLFVVAVLGEHLGVDAEEALAAANRKFERRFRGVETLLAERGKRARDSDLAEMDALWDAVKASEKGRTPPFPAKTGNLDE